MAKIRGNKVLTGTYAEVWIDGAKIFECSKIEQKVIANREEVYIGADVDSKITSLKGEFSLTIDKVYTRHKDVFENWKQGKDQRMQIISKLGDPDAAGGQIERWSTDNCWFNELPLVSWEKGALVKQELAGGFTPSDMISLDEIKVI